MPYSDCQYWETASPPGSTHAAFKEFAVFLNGRHGTQTNAVPWEIIDCYDGTTREQPTNGDSNNLSAGNLWREDQGVPPQNSWATFQAPSGGDVVARFQIYIEMAAGSEAFIGIFMLNDWAVGAGTDANPTIPATSLGVPPFTGGMDGTYANHVDYRWQAWLDEGTIFLGCFPTVAGDPEYLYIGDLKPEMDQADDPRPFIISPNPDREGHAVTYLHVSVVDDTTIINTPDETSLQAGMEDAQDQDAFTTRPLAEVAVYSNEPSNYYRKGKLRLCSAISRHARGISATERVSCGVGATDYDYEVVGRGGTASPKIVLPYPPGTALDTHIQIVERSIPEP